MYRSAALVLFVVLIALSTRVASADSCPVGLVFVTANLSELRLTNTPLCPQTHAYPAPAGKVAGAGIIYLYANDEAKYSSLNNVLKAIEQLEGTVIYPGETFSFNKSAKLLEMSIPYDLGPDVRNNLVKAGGVCMVSTMIATAAHDAGLPFVNSRGKIIPRPVPHSRYYKYYHQVNEINNHPVAITEAAVAIERYSTDQPWQTVQDMKFTNNTAHPLVLHFEPNFGFENLDPSQPFGLIQQDYSPKAELVAIPNGLDVLLARLEHLTLN